MQRTGLFRAAVILLLASLLVAGIANLVLRAARPNNGIEILLPPPAPREVVVYVTGAVAHQGLYTLHAGDRAADAVKAAGGLTEAADASRVNLAARVDDGDHVHVPALGEAFAAEAGTSLLDLNIATAQELERLPGIGAVRAQAIVAFRDSRGSFRRIEDLLQVEGIGATTLERLRLLVTVR